MIGTLANIAFGYAKKRAGETISTMLSDVYSAVGMNRQSPSYHSDSNISASNNYLPIKDVELSALYKEFSSFKNQSENGNGAKIFKGNSYFTGPNKDAHAYTEGWGPSARIFLRDNLGSKERGLRYHEYAEAIIPENYTTMEGRTLNFRERHMLVDRLARYSLKQDDPNAYDSYRNHLKIGAEIGQEAFFGDVIGDSAADNYAYAMAA